MTNYRVAIGGPCAGEQLAVQGDPTWLRVEERPPLRMAELHEARAVPQVIKIFEYELQVFHTSEAKIELWVPKGQTPLQTMDMLVAGYCRDARR